MSAAELRHALALLKLSQEEAARRLGVRHSTLYRWLAGHRRIPGPAASAVECWLARARLLGRWERDKQA